MANNKSDWHDQLKAVAGRMSLKVSEEKETSSNSEDISTMAKHGQENVEKSELERESDPINSSCEVIILNPNRQSQGGFPNVHDIFERSPKEQQRWEEQEEIKRKTRLLEAEANLAKARSSRIVSYAIATAMGALALGTLAVVAKSLTCSEDK